MQPIIDIIETVSQCYREDVENWSLLEVVQSKWGQKFDVEVFSDFREDAVPITAITCIKDEIKVVFSDVQAWFVLKKGDAVFFPQGYLHSVKPFDGLENVFYERFFYRPIIEESDDTGLPLFEITATLTDYYTKKVRAENEEEALKIAYWSDIQSWKHVKVEAEGKQYRKIDQSDTPYDVTRWSEWGKFDIKKLE